MKISEYREARDRLREFSQWSRENRKYIPPKDSFDQLRIAATKASEQMREGIRSIQESLKRVKLK